MLRGTQVKRDGLVVTVARRVIASGIALKFLSCPRLHIRSAKTTLEKRHRPQGFGILRQSGLKVPGGAHKTLS